MSDLYNFKWLQDQPIIKIIVIPHYFPTVWRGPWEWENGGISKWKKSRERWLSCGGKALQLMSVTGPHFLKRSLCVPVRSSRSESHLLCIPRSSRLRCDSRATDATDRWVDGVVRGKQGALSQKPDHASRLLVAYFLYSCFYIFALRCNIPNGNRQKAMALQW